MMYFKSLLEGLSPLPSADEQVRSQIAAEAEAIGWQEMHLQLQIIVNTDLAKVT